MDVWEYFAQKEREFKDGSLVPERDLADMFAEEEGSDGKRGRVFGNLGLNERAFLRIHEVVVVQNNHIHREEYAYYLIIDGEEAWGYERDLSHDPPLHRHVGPAHAQQAASRVTFKEVVELAWRDASELE